MGLDITENSLSTLFILGLSNVKIKLEFKLLMEKVVLTNHVKDKLIERGLDIHTVKMIAKYGTVLKSDGDDKIKRLGESYDKKPIKVITSITNNKIIIITAYFYEA